MELTEANLYWILRLDAINKLFMALSILGAAVFVVLTTGFVVSYIGHKTAGCAPETYYAFRRLCVGCTIFMCAVLPIFVLLPTTNEMAMIKVLPAIVNNKQLQEDSSEIYRLAVDKLKTVLSTQVEEQ